jgi:putative membrane protein
MKRLSLPMAAIMAASVFCSCGNSSDNTTSTDTSTTTSVNTDVNTTTMDTGMSATTNTSTSTNTAPLEKMDRDFVMKAASGGMMEVELGNLAQQNASNQRVKDFASMMVRDHSKANDELMSFASRRNLMMNSDSLMNLHKSHIESMRKKTGKSFDKAYMDMMVNAHKKDVAEFEKASKMCKDQECLSFASKTLPVLQMHRDSAQAIHKNL